MSYTSLNFISGEIDASAATVGLQSRNFLLKKKNKFTTTECQKRNTKILIIPYIKFGFDLRGSDNRTNMNTIRVRFRTER